MKFCKDCRHYSVGKGLELNWCNSPKNRTDPVTGSPVRELCPSARTRFGACGLGGLLWEPKEPEKAPIILQSRGHQEVSTLWGRIIDLSPLTLWLKQPAERLKQEKLPESAGPCCND